ncbi:MAG: DUF2309 domain-containing protein [Bdellovibrionales bacterium]|nr:DUF2309 domain-containing protein [Bdellovibrionales bacterium]
MDHDNNMGGELALDRESTDEVVSSGFNVGRAIDNLAHWLPTQAPLKDFIHHNPLHAFQDRGFHEGVLVASRLYGAKPYLDLEVYQQYFREGRISESALERVLLKEGLRAGDKAIREELLRAQNTPAPSGPGAFHQRWFSERGVDLDGQVHRVLFRILSNYLDQGVSIWRMPHAGDTLWNAVARIVDESYLPFPPLSDRQCKRLLKGSPDDAIRFCLERLVGSERHYEAYLFEMLLAHPGWSGMVVMTENNRSLLLPRKVSLRDMVAIELLLEYGFLTRSLGDFEPLVGGAEPVPVPTFSLATKPIPTRIEVLQRIWHEALEWSYYEDLLKALQQTGRMGNRTPKQPKMQAFFCIDDRETSLRRYLEEESDKFETWGVAGFFGVDWLFQSAASGVPTKLCPAPVKPKHLVREVRKVDASDVFRKPKPLQLLHLTPSNTLFRGWLITQVLGLWHALRLAWQVFLPSQSRATDQSLSQIEPLGELQLLREGDQQTEDGLYLGYSMGEMVERVEGVLKSTGCTKDFSDLMVFVSHGASSVNNPYFAAYDCGACSGRPGAANARAIAWMANHPTVREGLRARGIDIPDSCRFLGAFHDTTRDEVTYFNAEELSASHRESFLEFSQIMETALQRNARERCRRFDMVSKDFSPAAANVHVKQRATSIFEPRPELNHATNASCVVARRDLSRGLFLDRRAFLNSYDPATDPSGNILQGILGAVIPVCGGINLEYLFSRIDSTVYGAGTKLPHNVMGLIGVANGTEGDLLTGLPTQMTELHDPVRILIVVEQKPELVLQVLGRNPNLMEWVKNEWVRFACIHPEEKNAYIFEGTEFVPAGIDPAVPLPEATHSEAVFGGSSAPIPVHLIGRTKP